jgi:hypothetical protein
VASTTERKGLGALQWVVGYLSVASGDPAGIRVGALAAGLCFAQYQPYDGDRSCEPGGHRKEDKVITILIVILLLMALGAIPTWPHSRNWGYAPSGTLGLILIILLVLALTGRL